MHGVRDVRATIVKVCNSIPQATITDFLDEIGFKSQTTYLCWMICISL